MSVRAERRARGRNARPSAALRAGLLVALGLAGCGTTRKLAHAPLPFHVAVLPIAVHSTATGSNGAEAGLRLELDPARLASTLATELDGRGFARATVLALPEELTAEALANLSDGERDALWIAAAERAGTDLVLECELSFAPEVRGSINEKFWLNLPLFLLGGPFCYFVDDRSYRADARLRGSVYELQAMFSERASLQDGRARLGQAEVRFESADFDFVDRAGGNVGSYAASVLVPSGLLARETERITALLGERVTADLARELARELVRQERELLEGERVATFHLEPAVQFERVRGRIDARGTVVLRCVDTDHLDELRLRAGTVEVSGEFGASEAAAELSTRRDRFVRIPFHADLADDGRASFAQIVLVGGGPIPSTRTFTLPLPSAATPTDGAVAAR